ncbi:undecaprenyl-diphosphate phosphatase [Halocynthiibacter styelae]|uniref:Undecaprenyl-diphosphatase n=1 Tax=Halocynthiibacter styelae TaxID=2761955 RepID=A0A8J7LKW8_9RHOB|nr:undecaprenyl-diphosphate phosphatase [Paenihalocynthiibacter styelae]MBI1494795.1 undecaprenyl-diphosphate phosphatase [Paenihalocynthiibacter styelae]
MSLFHLFLVAIIQGLTEFLPVSSSGHLILLPVLTGAEDQGQVIDVAVHLGTLIAVVIFFWREVSEAALGLPRLATGKADTPGSKLALLLIIATIPAIIFGLMLKLTGLDDMMRSIKVIGFTMIGFGIVLYIADQKGPTKRNAASWGLRDAIVMGLWQAVALIPGTSRSGATITGARSLGFNREDAARLSMLMSIPTILAAGGLLGLEVATTANMQAVKDGAVAAAFACVAALLALTLMMRLLRSVSYTPYVIYRIGLGVVLLWFAYA